MKKILKIIIKYQLRLFAKVYLWRTKPEIIVITGITNRRSFKEIIFDKLNQQGRLRLSPDNHNAEFGIPLSILGLKINKRSDWWSLVFQAKWRAYFGKKVDKIILEVAIDKPNDMDYVLKIFTPKVVIITNVEPAYMENFGTLDNIALEYKKLISAVLKDGLVVLNNDDVRVQDLAQFSKAKVATFSINNNSNYQAKNITKIENGQEFEVQGQKIQLNKFGEHYIQAELAGRIIENYYKTK
jgi:UDP-N-acetylmuramyl pentapeptide synthase